MISIVKYNREAPREYMGLSTDDKPLDATINSLFLELDTGDFYYLKSLGGSSTTRETLIEEQSFTGETYGEIYVYEIPSLLIDENEIKVVFDGTEYSCTGQLIETEYIFSYYGAIYYENGEAKFDFSVYPFGLYSTNSDDNPYVLYIVQDANEHTIEVYTESTVTTPTVWEKVGGGSSAPTPVLDVKLVITEESPDVTLISATYVITNNIYDSVQWTGEPIAPGEYHYLLPVFYSGNEDTGYESYLPFATNDSYYGESSDLNNCTIQDAVVTVTDPTKNASITITFDAV